MTDREAPEESEARRFFESLGYVATRLPESSHSRQADYSVQNGVDQLLVEVKSRRRDEGFDQDLEQFGRAQSQQTLGRRNPISKQISDAAGQLAATAAENSSSLRLVVFVTADDDPKVQFDQVEATLYGKIDLLCEGSAGVVAVPCFYFTFSEFFRTPSVDAAMVLTPMGGRLLINAFSGRRGRLGASKLYQELLAAGAVTDSEAQELMGDAFLADTDIDRRDEAAILSYIRNKYGRPGLLAVVPTRFRAAIKIPHQS
jgi:hypothetical protein